MRTTISIDDSLLRQAKSTAALEGKTLSELIEEKLRKGLTNNDYRPPYVIHGKGGAKIDLSSNAEIWRVLEQEEIEKFHAINRRKHTD